MAQELDEHCRVAAAFEEFEVESKGCGVVPKSLEGATAAFSCLAKVASSQDIEVGAIPSEPPMSGRSMRGACVIGSRLARRTRHHACH